MNNESRGHLHIGTPSIILIFMTLCLVSFSVLSLVNANADYRLSAKLADRTRAYYDSVSKAEEFIRDTNEELLELYKVSENEEDFIDEAASLYGEYIEAEFPIGEREIQFLHVILEPTAPAGENEACYRILSYRIENDESGLEYDESLHVYW